MEQHALKNANICWEIQKLPFTQRHLVVEILIHVKMLFIFSTPVLIRHLWQLNTVVFLHRFRICVLFQIGQMDLELCAYFFWPALAVRVLNKDPTIWLDETRQPQISLIVCLTNSLFYGWEETNLTSTNICI
jgi:hypothetical protein